MSREEFYQSLTAILHATTITLNNVGPVVPFRSVVAILQTHCSELRAEVSSNENGLTKVTFSDPHEPPAAPTSGEKGNDAK